MYDRSADWYGGCLKFRYIMYGAGFKTLSVHQALNEKLSAQPLWKMDTLDNTTVEWQYGQVTVGMVTNYKVSYKVMLASQKRVGTTWSYGIIHENVALQNGVNKAAFFDFDIFCFATILVYIYV